MAWLSLIFQVLIVGTGGAVRLTGSGLGCPTWPRCTADSLVATPEQGVHGVIEFGNRLLTFVLVLVAIAAFLAVVRFRRRRPDLFGLTIALGLGIPAQAVLGGVTVLTGLNPYLVGAHFVVSTILVVIATVFVVRVRRGGSTTIRATPPWFAVLVHVGSVLVAVTVLLGILTTGSGPHAGDAQTPRNGFNSTTVQHLHSYPAYALFGLTLALVAIAVVLRLQPIRRMLGGLLLVEIAQIVVGIVQARLGLPEILVGIHMVLACVLVAAATAVELSLRVRTGDEGVVLRRPETVETAVPARTYR